jgi:hypothetical protein
MNGPEIILTCDFYQTPLVQDSWIFKCKYDGFDVL